jgi:hypothetical protein
MFVLKLVKDKSNLLYNEIDSDYDVHVDHELCSRMNSILVTLI